MTTENNTIKLTLELTHEQWALLRKATFAQSKTEETEALSYRKLSKLRPNDEFYSNYAKIHAERYLVIKEAKEQIDNAFKEQLDTYWHNIEDQGDIDTREKLSITDED
jgi:hypothetical protein